MMRRIGSYLSNNVLGALALVVAASGTAYAAATIGSAEIVDDSIRSIDIRTGGVAGSDVLDEGIGGVDIRNGSVREVDLAAVPWQVVQPPSRTINCDQTGPDDVPATGEFCTVTGTAGQFWTNYGEGYDVAKFRRNADGQVSMQGLVKQVNPDEFSRIFILPEGFRPAGHLLLPVACGNGADGDLHGVLQVGSDGVVVFRDTSTDCVGSNYVSLSSITFRTG